LNNRLRTMVNVACVWTSTTIPPAAAGLANGFQAPEDPSTYETQVIAMSRGYNGQRGAGWIHGREYYGAYNHYLPPNSAWMDMNTCGYGIFGVRSNHGSGAHIVRCDGGVQFVANSIELRVWRAYGTRAGAEIISSDE
jgi:hypothetical protein